MNDGPQFVFHDGQWRDAWNNLTDTGPQIPGFDDDWEEMILMQHFCGCGSPDAVVKAMRDYMNRVRTYTNLVHQPGPLPDGIERPVPDDDLAALLLAYIADHLGFTDHGGSVYGAWITDAGSRWLDLCDGTARSTEADRQVTP